jgi:hypothetical protein
MRTIGTGIVVLLTGALSPALAGITVTSYQTVALTNAFAPLSQSQYFAQETLVNVSPALAQVSGDWTGTNAGGSTNTWHWVGSSQASSTTAFDANSYTVTAAGSFAYELDTTAEFIDPRSSNIYTPGGAADYQGFFTLDTAAEYTITVELTARSRVLLGSVEAGFIFNASNHGTTPQLFQRSGTIPAGHYEIRANSSLAAPLFPNGVNHFEASGGFADLIFNVQVPEPAEITVLALLGACGVSRRLRPTRQRG